MVFTVYKQYFNVRNIKLLTFGVLITSADTIRKKMSEYRQYGYEIDFRQTNNE